MEGLIPRFDLPSHAWASRNDHANFVVLAFWCSAANLIAHTYSLK